MWVLNLIISISGHKISLSIRIKWPRQSRTSKVKKLFQNKRAIQVDNTTILPRKHFRFHINSFQKNNRHSLRNPTCSNFYFLRSRKKQANRTSYPSCHHSHTAKNKFQTPLQFDSKKIKIDVPFATLSARISTFQALLCSSKQTYANRIFNYQNSDQKIWIRTNREQNQPNAPRERLISYLQRCRRQGRRHSRCRSRTRGRACPSRASAASATSTEGPSGYRRPSFCFRGLFARLWSSSSSNETNIQHRLRFLPKNGMRSWRWRGIEEGDQPAAWTEEEQVNGGYGSSNKLAGCAKQVLIGSDPLHWAFWLGLFPRHMGDVADVT